MKVTAATARCKPGCFESDNVFDQEQDRIMTPEEMRARQPLLASAPNVPLNTALWRFWRTALAPITIGCAAIAGAHAAYFARRRNTRR